MALIPILTCARSIRLQFVAKHYPHDRASCHERMSRVTSNETRCICLLIETLLSHRESVDLNGDMSAKRHVRRVAHVNHHTRGITELLTISAGCLTRSGEEFQLPTDKDANYSFACRVSQAVTIVKRRDLVFCAIPPLCSTQLMAYPMSTPNFDF
jgi:hypothetical protein